MTTCDDCGERVYGGICTNCHEELYIEVTQGEDMLDVPRSDNWLRTVEKQRRAVAAKATSEQSGSDRREREARSYSIDPREAV